VLRTSSLLLTDTLKSSDAETQEKEGETEVQRGSLLEILDQATTVSFTTNDLTNQERVNCWTYSSGRAIYCRMDGDFEKFRSKSLSSANRSSVALLVEFLSRSRYRTREFRP
jgi:hypothetical protein